jgi:hypothetical protein
VENVFVTCEVDNVYAIKGSSINDVTSLGGEGVKDFVTTLTMAVVKKSVTMGGGGVKNKANLRDVIYG